MRRILAGVVAAGVLLVGSARAATASAQPLRYEKTTSYIFSEDEPEFGPDLIICGGCQWRCSLSGGNVRTDFIPEMIRSLERL